MPYCKNCGTEVSDSDEFCPKCGASQVSASSTTTQSSGSQDTGSFGWAVLGFLFPVVGLILWLVWKNDQPKNAHMAGMGALVSVILVALFFVLIILVVIGAGIAANNSMIALIA